ncbi:c-type cytochrome [Sulfurimonas autotrophica]|uniref:Cytochrome c n=1 Tax=Sulfurimonas autotrophica (strain ATCC BAA-671 / DSM 16294 / JCM 11897 / OK10) TaxID=563040 RepID=E0UUB9_SULAO|nr:cytochrome c [Sulfurimonas autotrophica DSM 16294]
MKIVLSVILAMLIVGCSDEKGSQKSVQKPVEKAKTVVDDVEKKVQTSVAKVKEVTKVAEVTKNTVSIDGAKLFTVCSSCHGAHAEKKALGKSQIIKGWDEAKIIMALKGYKDGTYGGAMKAVMKGQVTKLSEDDIKALAKYISNL